MKKTAIVLGLLALASAGGASAHHSYTMFDREKSVTLSGTVETFKWTNPHSWIEFRVPNAKGGSDKWGVEMTAPAMLVRAGWRSTTLKSGDQVSITLHPLRSGEFGGAFVSVKLPDGKVMTDKAPAAPKAS